MLSPSKNRIVKVLDITGCVHSNGYADVGQLHPGHPQPQDWPDSRLS